MKIEVDRSVYSDECISKCVYSLLADYDIERYGMDGNEMIEIMSKTNMPNDVIRKNFFSRLNDYKTRDIITKETRDIRVILYAKAFADNEDYKEDVEP